MENSKGVSKMRYLVLLLVALVAGCAGHDNVDRTSVKTISAFALDGVAGTVNETAKSIAVTVPFGKNVTALVATYTTISERVQVGTTTQTSGTTANNFTAPVEYTVTASDGTTTKYTVTVTVADVTARALSSYAIAGVSGTVDETTKNIAVTLPSGTNIKALVVTFATTGSSVKVGDVTQISGITSNDFTAPVTYTVAAADNSTASYTVTVTVVQAAEKAITAYSFAGFTGAAGIINEPAKTIAVTVPYGTNIGALVATFTATGNSVKVGSALQTSVTTPNNFTAPVAYIVTAADGTQATYTVTVTAALVSAKEMTTFSFAGYAGAAGIINEAAKTITVTVPNGTNVTALVATFTTTGNSVKVGAVTQTSVATPNNFTTPVTYTVNAADGSTATYAVSVTVAQNSAKKITAFSFAGFTGAAGIINDAAKTIAVTVPNGTNLTALVATFATTGTGVKVGSVVQTSVATPNNFTTPVTYTVTAADGSTDQYVVTVTAAQPSAKTITAFSLAGATGIIDGATKAITVTVPNGTSLTALVATFATTGASVKVGTAVQTSNATANNFTNAVTYTVTAADGSTAPYVVTVSVSSAKGPAAVNLGTAGNYVILAETMITTTGTTAITGDLGISPAAATYIQGFSLTLDPSGDFSLTTPSTLVTGKVFAADYNTGGGGTPAKLTTAVGDMMTAYTDAAGRPTPDFTELYSGDISGQTLVPGLYKWGTGVLVTSDVTLNGGPNDVWIFQIAQDVTIANGASVKLTGGAMAKNVFWQVAGGTGVAVGTTAHIEGIVMAIKAITLNTGASATGRLLAQTAVTLKANAVTAP